MVHSSPNLWEFHPKPYCLSQSVVQATGLCGQSVPLGGFQGLSECSQGKTVKAPKIFPEGRRFAFGKFSGDHPILTLAPNVGIVPLLKYRQNCAALPRVATGHASAGNGLLRVSPGKSSDFPQGTMIVLIPYSFKFLMCSAIHPICGNVLFWGSWG